MRLLRAFKRYQEVAQRILGSSAKPDDLVIWLKQLVQDLHIPALSSWGLTESHIAEAVSKAKNASSMKGNPVVLTDEELSEVLRSAL